MYVYLLLLFFHFINLARLLKYKAALSPFLVTSFYYIMEKEGKREFWAILGRFGQVWTIFGKLGQVWTRQQIRKWENSKKAERISKENKNLSSN